jgi:hypothetical protein
MKVKGRGLQGGLWQERGIHGGSKGQCRGCSEYWDAAKGNHGEWCWFVILRLDWAESGIQETRKRERAMLPRRGVLFGVAQVFSDLVSQFAFLYPQLARRIQCPRSPEKSFLEPITSLPSL